MQHAKSKNSFAGLLKITLPAELPLKKPGTPLRPHVRAMDSMTVPCSHMILFSLP